MSQAESAVLADVKAGREDVTRKNKNEDKLIIVEHSVDFMVEKNSVVKIWGPYKVTSFLLSPILLAALLYMLVFIDDPDQMLPLVWSIPIVAPLLFLVIANLRICSSRLLSLSISPLLTFLSCTLMI